MISHLRHLGNWLFPPLLQEDPGTAKSLRRWLLLGLLLRLVFMPFAAHNDYLSEHYRAEQVAFGGVVYPTRLELGSHYLDALTLRLIAPLVPEHGRLFWSPRAEDQSNPHAGPLQYARFAAYPRVNRALFLTKIPYLLFDLAGGLLLLHLFKDAGKARRAFAYWMVSPVMIFSVYVFGRYEAYAAALALLSLLLVSRGQKAWGALALGLAVLFRASMLLVVPVYVMAVSAEWDRRVILGVLALLPMSLSLMVFEGAMGLSPAFVSSRRTGFISLLLSSVGTQPIYPYVVGYMSVLLGLYVWSDRSTELRRYALGGLFVLQLIFITTGHSIVYYAWTMPFLVWLVGDDQRMAKFFWWQVGAWAFYWLLATDEGVFTPYLFAPLSRAISSARPTPKILAAFEGLGLSALQAVSAARSVLVAVSTWVVLFALRLEVGRQPSLSNGEVTNE